MDLQRMLGQMPQHQFVEEFFHRQPMTLPGTAAPLCEQVDWDAVCAVLAAEGADVMVVKQGRQLPGVTPLDRASIGNLLVDGHTMLVRHAERHDPRLRDWAEHFRRDFAAEVDVHVYVTPPGQHGFSWHYDAEDVFIIQTAGKKEYSLRKNTVHPWPLVETIPEDMQYPREVMPLMRVLLAPGDWLYIPNGYWHKAEAGDGGEPSISLALGVLSPSAMDVFDHLRTELLSSLLWRGRLPVTGSAASQSAEQCLAQYRELARMLASDLQRTLTDDRFLRGFIERQSGRDESTGS